MPMHPRSRCAVRPHPVLTLMIGTFSAFAASAEVPAARARIDPHCEIVADVRTDDARACWRVECTGQAPREIGCDLTALHQIVSIVASDDANSLSVLSVGEGHPILEIVPLPPLLEQGSYDGQCSVNPYPGNVDAGRWQNDHWLIQSDTDLLIEGVEERANAINGSPYSYALSLPDCKLAVSRQP